MATPTEQRPEIRRATWDELVARSAELRDAMQAIEAEAAPDALAGRLVELHEFLARHYAEEETIEGLYRTVRRRAPHFSMRVDQLRADHESLLHAIDRLATTAAAANDPAAIHARAAALVDRLREHELADGMLLTDSVIDEHGGEG